MGAGRGMLGSDLVLTRAWEGRDEYRLLGVDQVLNWQPAIEGKSHLSRRSTVVEEQSFLPSFSSSPNRWYQ